MVLEVYSRVLDDRRSERQCDVLIANLSHRVPAVLSSVGGCAQACEASDRHGVDGSTRVVERQESFGCPEEVV